MPTVLLRGTITAAQPISYTVPGDEAQRYTRGLNYIGGKPILTASSVRGRLRHGLAEVISASLPQKLSLNDYVLLAQGGIKDAKKKKKDEASNAGGDGEAGTIDALLAYRLASKNPALKLFGSLAYRIQGKLYCGHAIAVSIPVTSSIHDGNVVRRDVVPVSSVRTDVIVRTPAVIASLRGNVLDQYLARKGSEKIRSALVKELKSMRENILNATLQDEKNAIDAQIKSKESELQEHVTVPTQLRIEYTAIPQGSVFTHEMVLERVGPNEIGAFLTALRAWARRPYFGGHQSHGCGRIDATWEVFWRDTDREDLAPAGRVTIDSSAMRLLIEGRLANDGYEGLFEKALLSGKYNFSVAGLAA